MVKMTNNLNDVIKTMSTGDELSIENGLKHSGALLRINGIIFAVKFELKNKTITDLIKTLTYDEVEFNGYTVSQFAVAALDIMNFEKYQGNDKNIKALIDSGLMF